jgi:hypothetical protein
MTTTTITAITSSAMPVTAAISPTLDFCLGAGCPYG